VIFSIKYTTKEHYEAKERICPSCSEQADTIPVQKVELSECTETGQFLECTNCSSLILVHANPEVSISDLSPVDVRWEVQVAQIL